MAVLRLAEFSGMIPAMDESLLPDNAAVMNLNTDPGAGGILVGLPQLKSVGVLLNTRRYAYRIPRTDDVANLYAPSAWLAFDDPNSKVVRTPNVNDSFQRYYWTTGTDGMRYAPRDDLAAELGTDYKVGVPSPGASIPAGTPVFGVTGNTTVAPNSAWVTRAYVLTYINIFGEESPPCPPVEAVGYATGGAWAVNSIPQPPVLGVAPYAPLAKLRIYRTVTGSSGATTFFKVADIPIDPNYPDSEPTAYPDTYNDTLSDSVVSGNVQITATLNTPPVDGMRGLTLMPNGVMVGFKDNNLYFSEAYKPWSWPPEYTLSVEHPIVGLGVVGQTCVVCTIGHPAAVTGLRPDAMALLKHAVAMPCLSAGSIVSTMNGVIWASDQGLAAYANGTFTILSENIGRDAWLASFFPSEINAMMVGNEYVAFTNSGQGFIVNPGVATGVRRLSFVDELDGANALIDIHSGRPLRIGGGAVKEFAPPNQVTTGLYTWRSKQFRLEEPLNFSAFQLRFKPHPNNATTNYVQVRVYCGTHGESSAVGPTERLVYNQTHNITQHNHTFRLPGGFKSDAWRFEFIGIAPLREAMFATSVAELRLA